MLARPALASALGVFAAFLATGDADPTAVEAADALWLAAAGAIVAVGAAGAGSMVCLLVAAVLAPAAWGDAVAVVAVVAIIAGAHASRAWPRVEPALSVGIAPLVVVALLRLSWPARFGATAAVAGALSLAIVIAALARASRRGRRAALAALGAAAALLTLVSVSSGIALARERSTVDRAVDVVEEGLDASRRGDVALASSRLAEASVALDDLHGRLDRVWLRVGRGVPVLAQQLTAVQRLVEAARDLAHTGAGAAAATDTERLRPRNGRVDLDALTDLDGSLAEVRRALEDARTNVRALRSPWLLPVIDRAADDLVERTVDVERDTLTARRALAVLPDILGRNGERRWFVAIMTPSELRGAGGHPGSYGIIRTDGGRIELERMSRIVELINGAAELEIPTEGPREYLDRYQVMFGIDEHVQNTVASPHWPSVAESFAARYRAISGERVDGAIGIDPDAFAAMLQLVGPVSVPEWPVPITADNARSVLLHEQYVALDAEQQVRADFLSDVGREVFDAMTGGALPAPDQVGAALSPLLPKRHIQLWSARADEQAWFEDIGASGRLAPLRSDALGIISSNGVATKGDWFLHRAIDYRLEVASDGAAHGVVTVRLRNDSPASGLPVYVLGGTEENGAPPGWNRTIVSVFSPLAGESVTVDGAPAVLSPATREQGRTISELTVAVPPGGETVVRFELRGRLPVAPYRLDLHHQPTVHPDDVRVVVNGKVLHDGPQDADLVLRPAG